MLHSYFEDVYNPLVPMVTGWKLFVRIKSDHVNIKRSFKTFFLVLKYTNVRILACQTVEL